jgi:sec-independent protein translocase protein TatC
VRRDVYPDDVFAHSRMPLEEHLQELAVRMRQALAGVCAVMLLGVAADFTGMYLKLPWLGFGFPALRFITAPAEKEVDAFYLRRYDAIVKQIRAARAEGKPNPPETLTLRIAGPGPDRVDLLADVDPVELARIAKLGELRAGFRRPLTTLSVQEAMVTYFKVAFVLALVAASPWVFYQAWAFVAAGLYPHERQQAYSYFPVSVALFLAGVAVCQFLVMPAAVRAMLDFNDWTGFDPDLRLREWMGLAVMMPVVFGLSFQTPLVMAFFTQIGVTTARGYLRYWKHAVLGLALFAAVITPTQDLITWSYLFGPMLGLYLVGVGVCRMIEPRPRELPPACDV